MNIWRLQILTMLKQERTMRKTADSLFVSPATISQQIKLLEIELGLSLIEKQGRNILLNRSGEELVRKVQPLLNNLETVENEFKNRESSMTGEVRIAVFTSALNSLIIPAVKKVSNTYPNIFIQIFEEEPEQSVSEILSHKLDIVIAAYFNNIDNIKNSEISYTKLGEDDLKIVSSDLNTNTNVRFSDLAKEKWIIEPRHRYLPKHIIKLCNNSGFIPLITGELNNYDSIKESVRASLGISILPSLALSPNDKLQVHDLPSDTNPNNSREIYLLQRKSQKYVKIVNIVSKMIISEANSFFLKNS